MRAERPNSNAVPHSPTQSSQPSHMIDEEDARLGPVVVREGGEIAVTRNSRDVFEHRDSGVRPQGSSATSNQQALELSPPRDVVASSAGFCCFFRRSNQNRSSQIPPTDSRLSGEPRSDERNAEGRGRVGALELGVGSVIHPCSTFEKMRSAENGAELGWLFTGGFSTLYSGTALILGLRGFEPYAEPILPIEKSVYYLAQSGFTVPVSVASMGLGFGVAFGLAKLFGSNVEPGRLWGAYSAALVIPSFLVYWVPETVYASVAEPGSAMLSDELELARQAIVAPLWMVALNTTALTAVADLRCWQGAIASIVSTMLTGVTMATLFR